MSLTAADAAALDLDDRALARVTSAAGNLVVPVEITDALPAGVGLIPKGGWPKLRTDHSNVNVLTVAERSDMGESTSIHGLEVVVTPVGSPGP